MANGAGQNSVPQISDAEWEVMKAVWDAQPVPASDVVDRLAAERGWAPRTVKTMLNRLVAKGALGYEVDGKRTFANTPAMVKLFAERTGVPYPWSKYAQIVVSDFIFGGMENTGATTKARSARRQFR